MKNINYDEEVNEWIKMAKEQEEEEWTTASEELDEAMDENFHYNLKTGFKIMRNTPYFSSSVIGTILLKCAQCSMRSKKSEGTMPLCRCNCSLWHFMSEQRYKLPNKEIHQRK